MIPRRGDLARTGLGAGLVIFLVIVVWLAYLPGLSASYYFDDAPNLTGLEQVVDSRSALEFVVSGRSGPSGRPLALASFLLNVDDWPARPGEMRRVNVLFHILNSLLVVWLGLLIARARGVSERRANTIGIIGGALWALLPILASTSMMITQRMTSLSALFVLTGLLLFTTFHGRLAQAPRGALLGMTAALGLFTVLAILCKENGGLLPVYALALTILLQKPSRVTPAVWRSWMAVFLWLPLLMILGYLAHRVPYESSTQLLRDFTAWERLTTQAWILWEYMFNAVLPMSTAQFGPFHDDLQVSRNIFEPAVLAATIAWMAALTCAVRYRRKLPVLSFSILWFIGGHLVESTTIPLELYFEHRNYLPLVGPAIGLAWLATSVPREWMRFALTTMTAYILLLGWTTAQVTDEWGSPLQFSETKYRNHPESPRAAGFFASHLLAIDRPDLALYIVEQAIDHDNDSLRLRLAAMPLACAVEDGGSQSQSIDVAALAHSLMQAKGDRNLARALHDLVQHSLQTGCPPLSDSDMEQLTDALEANSIFSGHAESRYWLHRARERLAYANDDREGRKRQLLKAQDERFDPFTIELWTSLQLEDGLAQKACERLQNLWRDAPLNPIRRTHRRLVLEQQALVITQTSKIDCKIE